jgi:hypothetical protein
MSQYETDTTNKARAGRCSTLKRIIIIIFLLNIIKVIISWENIKLSLREIGCGGMD